MIYSESELIKNMKKQIIYIVLVLLMVPFVGFAEEDQVTKQNKREEVRLQIQAKTENLELEIKEKKQNISERLNQIEGVERKRLSILAQERVQNAIHLFFERIEATVVRQEGIANRIESRIQTSELEEELLKEVTELFEQSRVSLNDSFVTIIASKSELLDRVKMQISQEEIVLGVELSRNSLIETHTLLTEIVTMLKLSEELE